MSGKRRKQSPAAQVQKQDTRTEIKKELQVIPINKTECTPRDRKKTAQKYTGEEVLDSGLRLINVKKKGARKGKMVRIKIPVVERHGVPVLVLVFGVVMGMLAGYLMFECIQPQNSQYINASEITGYTAEDDTLTLEREDGYEYKIHIEENDADLENW